MATDVGCCYFFVFFVVKVAITRDVSENEKPAEQNDEVSVNKQPFLL